MKNKMQLWRKYPKLSFNFMQNRQKSLRQIVDCHKLFYPIRYYSFCSKQEPLIPSIDISGVYLLRYVLKLLSHAVHNNHI